MTTRLGWLIPFLLAGVVLTGLLISLAKHMFKPAPPAAAPSPALAPTEVYTFPSVIHTPEETARARLACADMGDYGWTIAQRRERTGMTLDEALALLAKEHKGTPAFRPLERVTYLAYTNPSGTPEWVRGFVQRVCLRDMLGSLTEPKVEPLDTMTTPVKKRGATK
jgi:hypothetical protein